MRKLFNRRIFCQRLRALRLSKNLTGEQVAELCDINSGYYRKLESGNQDASLNMILILCEGLGVSPDYFLGYDHKSPDFVAHRKISSENRALIQDLTDWLLDRFSD